MVDSFLESYSNGDKLSQQEAERQLRRYLTQATYLQKSDARTRLDNAEDWRDQVYEQTEVLNNTTEGKKILDKSATVSCEVRASGNIKDNGKKIHGLIG
jgi:hypothetical protein